MRKKYVITLFSVLSILFIILAFYKIPYFSNEVHTAGRSLSNEEMSQLMQGVSSLEDYANRLHSVGFISDEEYAAGMAKIGKGVESATSTTPATPSTPTRPITPKCDHEYTSEVTKEPTCVDEGITTYTCSKCGNTYTESIEVNKDAHEYKEEVTKEATCTEAGERTFTCSLCDDTYSEEIAPLGHDYISAITTEPTCTEAGIKTYTCTRCNDTYTEEVAALGHEAGDWTVVKENTLFSNGLKEIRCIRCNEVLQSEIIPSVIPMWAVCVAIVAILALGVIAGIIVSKKKKA